MAQLFTTEPITDELEIVRTTFEIDDLDAVSEILVSNARYAILQPLEEDPFNDYIAVNERGAIVTGKVKEVDAKQAVLQMAEEVEAVLKASEISVDRVEDARNAIKVDDEIEVKIISVDRKSRTLGVSIKAKDVADEQEAVREHREKESDVAPTTIGDLIKQQMDTGADEEAKP